MADVSNGGEQSSGTRVLDEARRRLETAGWSVTLHPTPRGFQIQMEHPLSTSYGIVFQREQTTDEQLAFLEKRLSQREFGDIASRPSETPHASLLKRVRQSAAAHPAWPGDVVPMFARILRHEGLLTDEEAIWLEAAPVPWQE